MASQAAQTAMCIHVAFICTYECRLTQANQNDVDKSFLLDIIEVCIKLFFSCGYVLYAIIVVS